MKKQKEYFPTIKKDGEKMANTKNLIPQAHVLTVEELSKGGTNSVASRRDRKRLKEELEILLEIGDTQKSVAAALINKALKGDVRAFEVIRDTIGEKPVERIAAAEVDPAIIAELEAIVLGEDE